MPDTCHHCGQLINRTHTEIWYHIHNYNDMCVKVTNGRLRWYLATPRLATAEDLPD